METRNAFRKDAETLSRLHKIAGCDNANRKADVVFIHGLGGDYAGTWRHGKDESTSWPHWLAADFPDVGVWSLGYAASPSTCARVRGFFNGDRDAGYSMSLPDRAGQVLDLMVQKHLGERPILFICHSLGGLLIKQILRKADDAVDPRKKHIAEQTRAVLFLATPHAGAELASLVNAFRTVFGATVSMEDLRLHDTHLRDLFDWYRNQSPVLGIHTETYYEMRGIKGVLPIVNPTSAHPGVGADPVPLDEDHLSIAKPGDRDEQVCDAARDLIRNYLFTPRSAAPVQPAPVPVVPEPPHVIVHVQAPGVVGDAVRIPCQLPPKAKKLFGRQTESKKLAEMLGAGEDCAVVGPAGMGKTALAADAVRSVVGNAGERLADSPFPDGVVYLDLYTHHGKAEPVWNNLANALAGPSFQDNKPAAERATEACRGRRVLIVIEGGEEADGRAGRATIPDIRAVFSLENRCLLLTRNSAQTNPAETVRLKEALHPEDAAGLFDSITEGRVTGAVREQVLGLLEGNPLALTWAGGLLARDDDDPVQMAAELRTRGPKSLSDPERAEHTLEWLFNRSVRGLDDTARQLLAAAGLLARIPFPLAAMTAALGDLPDSVPIAREALRSLVRSGFLQWSEEETGHWQFTHVLGYRFARKETGSDPDLRERLAGWLSGCLKSATASRAESALLTRALEHAGALLRADDDQRLWISLAHDLLYDICDRLTDLGRLDGVELDVGAVEEWLGRLPPIKAHEPEWLRERSTLLNRRGDMLRDQGHLDGSLTAYRASLAVIRSLAQADPSNAGWQRDLSVSQEKIGNVLRDQGDLVGALTAYRESLAMRRPLAQADPSNAGWQRDLSVSQEKIGDVLRDQGDLDGALTAYRESLAAMRPLAEADPSNAVWQRDLSVSHNKVGDVLHPQGDLDGALTAYRESLAAMRPLAEADPSNAVWQRDLSVSQDRIGNVLRDQGDLDGALTAYREALAVRRALAQVDPSNAVWQRDLSVSHNKVGDVLHPQGDLDGALTAYRQSLAVMRPLAEADPSNAVWQRDLSVSQDRIGNVLRDQGDLDGALTAYRELLAVMRPLALADPSNAGWQCDLSYSLTKMAQVFETQGNHAEALPFAEESLKIVERLAALDRTNVTWQKDVTLSRALVARLRGT